MAGCQTPDVQENQPVSAVQIELRDARLLAIDQFAVSGGLGIWTDEDNLSARVNWRQSADDQLSVALEGPLGIGSMVLELSLIHI